MSTTSDTVLIKKSKIPPIMYKRQSKKELSKLTLLNSFTKNFSSTLSDKEIKNVRHKKSNFLAHFNPVKAVFQYT